MKKSTQKILDTMSQSRRVYDEREAQALLDGFTMKSPIELMESDEFIIGEDEFYEKLEIYTKDISMNSNSKSFRQKSKYCKNPTAIFFEALLNLFQSLECSINGEVVYYQAYTHPLIIYLLRVLANNGLIEIKDLKKDEKKSYLLWEFFTPIGAAARGRKTWMYEIVFSKNRSLFEEDIELVKRIEDILHIDESELIIWGIDGVLSAELNSTLRTPLEPIEDAYESEEFLIEHEHYYGELGIYTKDISMNQYSLSLLLKSKRCKKPSAILLESIINFFQTLECSSSENPSYYQAYTQSLITYCLRILAKNGIIEIVDLKKDYDKYVLDSEFFTALGTNPRDKEITMYNVIFIKLRNLEEKDIDLIKGVERMLHIEDGEITFRLDDGLLSAKLKRGSIKAGRSIEFLPQK